MANLKEIDGKYYIDLHGTSQVDANFIYDTMRKNGSFEFSFKERSWRVSLKSYEEVKAYLEGIGKVGSSMKLPLFPYQEEVVRFCLEKRNALIVLPCGSGKTPIMISLYLDAKKRNLIQGPGLIVVKATLKTQWKKEVEKFSDLRASVLDTEKAVCSGIKSKISRRVKNLENISDNDEKAEEKRNLLEEEIKELEKEYSKHFSQQFENADLYIANYETLKDNAVRKELHRRKIEFIAADEIHYVKNYKAARSKALYEFANAKMRIGATATPIQKNPEDAYSIMKFISPSLFPSHSAFCTMYLRYSGYGIVSGSKNETHLRKKLVPLMIVKSKEEISSSLPDVVPITRYCTMDARQVDITNQLLEEIQTFKDQQESIIKQYKNPLKAKEDQRMIALNANIVARQTFAQEIADSEMLLLMSESELAQSYVTTCKTNAKMDLLVELLEEIISSGEKVCIFSKYKRMQDIITSRLKSESDLKDIKIAYVNGELSSEQRYDEVYNKFRDKDEYKILLMSDAGAEGVNLSKARYLIEYEPADSYLIQTQRRGRIERADSIHDTVFVYQLVAEKSYDEIALKVIAKKEKYDATIIKGIDELDD